MSVHAISGSTTVAQTQCAQLATIPVEHAPTQQITNASIVIQLTRECTLEASANAYQDLLMMERIHCAPFATIPA